MHTWKEVRGMMLAGVPEGCGLSHRGVGAFVLSELDFPRTGRWFRKTSGRDERSLPGKNHRTRGWCSEIYLVERKPSEIYFRPRRWFSEIPARRESLPKYIIEQQGVFRKIFGRRQMPPEIYYRTTRWFSEKSLVEDRAFRK